MWLLTELVWLLLFNWSDHIGLGVLPFYRSAAAIGID